MIGPLFPLETFISIRITLNQEAASKEFPRYRINERRLKDGDSHSNKKLTNGNTKDKSRKAATPISSPHDELNDAITPTSNGTFKPGLKEGTVRFMLDPQRAAEETKIVNEYFKVEWEEYEIEVEVERKVDDGREKRRS